MSGRGVRRVVCAAVRNPSGQMLIGPRHYDPVMQSQFHTYGWTQEEGECVQGFIDQWGEFMDRKEAWRVATESGQVLFRCGGDTIDGGTLFSENLY